MDSLEQSCSYTESLNLVLCFSKKNDYICIGFAFSPHVTVNYLRFNMNLVLETFYEYVLYTVCNVYFILIFFSEENRKLWMDKWKIDFIFVFCYKLVKKLIFIFYDKLAT